jgi:hypothetical protein
MKYLKRFLQDVGLSRDRTGANASGKRVYLSQIKEELEDIFIGVVDLGSSVHYSDCEETETVLVKVYFPQSGGLTNFYGITQELENVTSQIKGLGLSVIMEMRGSFCEIDIGEGNGKKRKIYATGRRKAMKK